MSRRCGIGIPCSSFANDSTGSVFVVMSQPQANAKRPPPPTGTAGRGWTEGLVQASRSVANPRMSSTKEDPRVASAGPNGPPRQPPRLLQLDNRALRFDLLFDLFGFLLGHAFLHGAGRAFHQVLGLLQAQAGNGPDLFDDLDLLLAAALQNDRELGLLFDGRSRGATTRCAACGRGRRRRRGRDRDAELLLERLDQLR